VQSVVEPFPDKTGTGWHVVIRYRERYERLIEGFASKAEARWTGSRLMSHR